MRIGTPKTKALLFRVAGHVAIAGLALVLPGVGHNRFWLAGLLVGVGSPIAMLINRWVAEESRNWAEASFDLFMVVTLIHLVPHLWMVAMCLGLMAALAPSVSLHPLSHWIYLCFGIALLAGMTLTVTVHNIQGWQLPIIAVAATYPSLLYYTYTQMQRTSELRQRAQLIRGMTELAGNVAHDFNNVMTTIRGHAELALADLPQSSPIHQDLTHILSGTTKASLLCNQLLSFAGHNVGRVALVDLKSELATMAGLFKPVMPAGVDIEVTLPEHPAHIRADASQVHQVLMNVLLNAGEAMIGQRGPITAQLCRIDRENSSQVPRVRIAVCDRGDGIPDNVVDRIFDPFFTTKDHGHGLGLASAKRIMESVEGEITVRSDSTGTRVELTWPEAPGPIPSAADAQASDTPAPSPAERLVLVVDDEPLVRSVAVRLLEKLDFETLEASDAAEAEALFEQHHAAICAVLLDLKMPVKDGWSCLRDLRRISKDTLVIVCSGYDPHDNQPDFALNDEHLAFLKKPYRGSELAAALSPVTDQSHNG